MAKRIETIKNAIITKLEGASHLRHVYGYINDNPDGYPYASVRMVRGEGEYADFSAVSKRNLRRQVFEISVYVERNEATFGAQKAERVSVEALDELLTAFDMDTTLSGTVKAVDVVSWESDYSIIGNQVQVARLTINCLDLVDAR